MISKWDAEQRFAASPKGVEEITTANSAVYGEVLIPPYTALEIRASVEEANIKLCRELLFDGELGERNVPSSGHVDPTHIWATDDEDADLGGRWDVSAIATTEPVLDKTGGTIDQSHVMEYALDDQDDVISVKTSNGRLGRGVGGDGALDNLFYEPPRGLVAGAAYTFLLRHLDSDNEKLLQYSIKEVRGHATAVNQWWDGSAWQDTEQWIDITGSGTEALFTDAVTLDEESEVVTNTDGEYVSGPAYYVITIRPKDDYASETSHIAHVGLCETISATVYDFRLGDDQSRKLVTGPYWTRIGTYADGTGTVSVAVLGGAQ
jgi:hypothetical protein